MKIGILALLLAVAVPAVAGHPPFQTARVISQTIEPHQVDRGIVTGTPIMRYSNVVVVDTAGSRMTWVETANYFIGTSTTEVKSAVPLPVNGTIQFFQDGVYFFVLDANHKKHKFQMTHMEAKEGEAAQ